MRRRYVAIITGDPELYAELAGTLRERRIPTVSLLPGQRIPENVAVVLTTADEARTIAHPRVLSVRVGSSRLSLWAAVEEALGSPEDNGDLAVGIDPGPTPGYAVISGRRCIAQGILSTPEEVAPLALHLRRQFGPRHVVVRVGTGHPLSRDRIVNALLERTVPVELVDEHGTTPRGQRRPRDPEAARRIAQTPGPLVRGRLPLRVTPGEVADLQRLSREGSEGRVTIPRAAAHRVLEGKLTLAEAVQETLARNGGPPLARGHRGERRVPHEPV